MKKILIFATLLFGIGLVSCQDEKGSDSDNDNGRLVAVETSSYSQSPILKSEVASGGSTSWSVGEEVVIVDVNGAQRVFTNTAGSVKATTSFKGLLLAEQGTQKYYAYHSACESPCKLVGNKITVIRKDLEVISDDAFNAARLGKYCSMIAEPISFDAEDTKTPKNIQFHHVNNFIEARISSINHSGALRQLYFDKVVFTVTATNATPFNTEITIDLKKIGVDPANVIPYEEGSGKVNTMSSTITYDASVNFFDRLTSKTSNFDIPIFALPTTTAFEYVADIIFYDQGVQQYHLRKVGDATGLNWSGLNILDFDEKNVVSVTP